MLPWKTVSCTDIYGWVETKMAHSVTDRVRYIATVFRRLRRYEDSWSHHFWTAFNYNFHIWRWMGLVARFLISWKNSYLTRRYTSILSDQCSSSNHGTLLHNSSIQDSGPHAYKCFILQGAGMQHDIVS